MPRQKYVVKFNTTTELYMIHYSPVYDLCEWGSLSHPNLLEWETLEGAEAAATSINSGTVGLPKP